MDNWKKIGSPPVVRQPKTQPQPIQKPKQTTPPPPKK